VNYLLDAFEHVQRQSTKEVSLLLVGDGSEEEKLRKQCVERGIRNVVVSGFKQKPEVPKYYGLADVFVFRTLGEPYGLVVDEAMAGMDTLPATDSAVAAAAAPALASSRAARAEMYGPDEGKELAPGVRLIELSQREAIIPVYKTVSMIDVVFQPGSHAPQETM
jgi:glycosyltransferase involved in cell wall biosynthesis